MSASEVAIYDGREMRGMVKELADGSAEAFAQGNAGEMIYIGKGANRREAVDLIHRHVAAALSGYPSGESTP